RKVEIRTPQRGAKREMMDLVNRNARLSFLQRFRAAMPSPATISKDVEEVLDLEKPPRRIECFDISNLQGSDVVASMVVWEDGRMKKSDYRRFIIRSLSGLPDDFQSMREVVTRRYKRIQDEGLSMPDLVLIDGGLGQLHAAQSALDELNIVGQSLASIAKTEEVIYSAGQPAASRGPLEAFPLERVFLALGARRCEEKNYERERWWRQIPLLPGRRRTGYGARPSISAKVWP